MHDFVSSPVLADFKWSISKIDYDNILYKNVYLHHEGGIITRVNKTLSVDQLF